MSEQALIDAMRPRSRNPKDERLEGDLERFGLGLKSASFAQARLLSVYSRFENEGAYATSDSPWSACEIRAVSKVTWMRKSSGGD
jgi:hypothetical protein